MFRKGFFLLTCTAAFSVASAQLTSTGPFVGTMSEGFESFPNYDDNGSVGNASLTVFGGFGEFVSASGAQNWIYEPGVADWGLIDNGSATVNGGAKGLGLYDDGSSVDSTLTFDADATSFGGYFNVVNDGGTPQPLNLTFRDSVGAQIDSTQVVTNIGGSLVWFGWTSTVGIRSIQFSGGEAPVMDDLQINAVPEPASMAILGLGAAALLRRRRK